MISAASSKQLYQGCFFKSFWSKIRSARCCVPLRMNAKKEKARRIPVTQPAFWRKKTKEERKPSVSDVVQPHFHHLRWRDRDCWNHSRSQYDSRVIVDDIIKNAVKLQGCTGVITLQKLNSSTEKLKGIDIFWNLSDSPHCLSSGLSPALPEIRACLLSSFSTARLNLGIFVPCKHPQVSEETAATLPWIPVPHLFVQESVTLSMSHYWIKCHRSSWNAAQK